MIDAEKAKVAGLERQLIAMTAQIKEFRVWT